MTEVCVKCEVFPLTDLLEGTDLPGIVFRLSSLIITKALMRLDSSSSAGSGGVAGLPFVAVKAGETFRKHLSLQQKQKQNLILKRILSEIRVLTCET